MHLKIGTRGSPLALAQTDIFIERFSKIFEFSYEIVKVKTTGDKILDKPLYDVGGKALFVKELEEALIAKQIDVAVHSLKDVPGVIDDRFILGCYLERLHPLDCLVSHKAKTIFDLPENSKVGSTSTRRAVFLKQTRPDLQIFPLRGNINTRLSKLLLNEYDAIILAEAGLRRLGLWSDDFCNKIPVKQMIPAVGQGVITTQVLAENIDLINMISKVSDTATESLCKIERDFLAELNANCRTPAAGFVEKSKECLRGSFMIASDDMECVKIHEVEFLSDISMDGSNIAKTMLEGFNF